ALLLAHQLDWHSVRDEDQDVESLETATERAGIASETPSSGATWILLLAVALTLGALYWKIAFHLVQQWADDDDYTHGFLIVPLALYFVWEKRAALKRMVPEPSVLGAVLLAAGLLTLVIGVVGAELFLQRFSLILVLGGLVLLVLGKALFLELL